MSDRAQHPAFVQHYSSPPLRTRVETRLQVIRSRPNPCDRKIREVGSCVWMSVHVRALAVTGSDNRSLTCGQGEERAEWELLHRISRAIEPLDVRVCLRHLRSAKCEGGLYQPGRFLSVAVNLRHLAGQKIRIPDAIRASTLRECITSITDKRAQYQPALYRHHSRSETTPSRAQFRQVTTHGAVQTVAPCHLCCILRRTKGRRIRALSEIRLRPRLRESTSVVGLPLAAPQGRRGSQRAL